MQSQPQRFADTHAGSVQEQKQRAVHRRRLAGCGPFAISPSLPTVGAVRRSNRRKAFAAAAASAEAAGRGELSTYPRLTANLYKPVSTLYLSAHVAVSSPFPLRKSRTASDVTSWICRSPMARLKRREQLSGGLEAHAQ